MCQSCLPIFFMTPCFGRQAIKFGAHYHKNNKTQQTLRLSVPSRRILRKIFPLFRRSLNSGFRTGEAAFLQTLIRKRKLMYRHDFFKSRLISPNFSINVLTEFWSHSKKNPISSLLRNKNRLCNSMKNDSFELNVGGFSKFANCTDMICYMLYLRQKFLYHE